MATTNKIGIILAVEGEKKFNQALQNSRKEAGSLKSEMNLLSTEYKDNANSLEYLQKKQDLLERQTKTYADAVKTAKNALENAQDTSKKAAENYEKLQKELQEAREEMARMSSEGKEGSKEYTTQSTKVEALAKALERQANQCKKAEGKVSDWTTKLNNASNDLEKTNQALRQNGQYLDEAANAADQCATSIDQFGNASKEAADTVTGLGDKIASAFITKGASEAVDLLKTGVTAAANAVKESMVDISSATSSLAAKTGLTGAALEEYKSVMEEIKGDNFGESYQEVAEAMGLVYQTMGQLSAADMTSVTESLMTLQDTFDMDMNETLRGAQSLVTHFGLSATEAFDMMAAGAQNGLNYTDELGDNLSEYAGKFAEAGYSVEEYFQLLQNGADGGAYNLDKINDAINEVTTRLADGTVEDSIDLFSDSTKETFEAWKEGGATQKEVIDSIVADIQNCTNEQDKMTMAAEAFGTMAEDGGTKFISSLTSVGDTFDNIRGKMDDLMDVKYDNVADAWGGLGAAVEENFITPIAEKAGPVVTDFLNGVTGAVEAVGDALSHPKSELESFIEEIESSNEAVQGLLDSASKSMNAGEVDVSNLEAYRDVLLDLNEKSSLTEFEQYQVQSAVQALSDTVPGLSEAFDSATGSLNLTNEELNELFNNAENVAMQNAIISAQTDLYDALAQATINQAKADSAVKSAQDDLTEAQEKNNSAMSDAAGGYGDYYNEVIEAENALSDAQKAQDEATEQMASAQEQIDSCGEALNELGEKYGLVTEGQESAAESTEAMNEAIASTGEAVAESTEQFDEWGNNITGLSEEQVSAIAEIEEAYDSMKGSIEDSIDSSISMFDEFSGGTAVSSDQILSNLQSQIDGISKWSENMQTLAGQIGTSFTQEMYDSLAEMGPESASLVQTLVDSLGSQTGEFDQIAQAYTEAMKLKDEAGVIASYTSAGQAAGEGLVSGVQSSTAAAAAAGQTAGQEVGTSVKEGVQEGAAGTTVTVMTGDEVTANAGEVQAGGQELGQSAKEGIDSVDTTSSGAQLASQFAAGLQSGTGAAAGAGISLASAALNAANAYSGGFSSVGYNMSAGLASGIRGGGSLAINAAQAVALNALRAAQAALQIKSPSRKFRKEVGHHIATGMAFGIRDKASLASKEAAKMSQNVYSKASSWLSKYKKSHKVSLDDEKYYWQQVLKHTKSGTTGNTNAMKRYFSVVTSQIKTNAKKNSTNAVKWSNTIYSNASAWLTKYKKNHKVSVAAEKDYWSKVVKATKSGTTANSKALDKYYGSLAKYIKSGVSKTETTGSGSSKKTTKKSTADYYGDVYDAAAKYMDRLQTKSNVSITNQLKYWKAVKKQLKSGTQAWYDATDEINSLKDKIGTVSNMSDLLDTYQTYYNMSAKANMQYWDIVRKKFKAGTDERVEADQKYLEAREDYYDELQDLADDYADDMADIKDQLADDIADLTDAYEDELADQKKAIMDAFDLFDEFTSESENGATLLFNIKTQVAGYEDWMETLEKLKARNILSDDLVEYLTKLGPDQSAAIHALNDLSDSDLADYNAAYLKKSELSQIQAEKNTADLKKETDSQIKALQDRASEDLKDLKAEYNKKVGEVKETISTELKTLASKTKSIAEDQTSALVNALKGNKKTDKVNTVLASGKTLSSLSSSERANHHALYNYLYDEYGVKGTNSLYKSLANALNIKVSDTVTSKEKTKILNAMKKKGYASGGVTNDDLTWMDEQLDTKGGEMIIRKSDNAILTRTKPGDQIIDADTTANLLRIGKYTPGDLAELVKQKASSYSALADIGTNGSTAKINGLLEAGAAAEQSAATAQLASMMSQVNDMLTTFAPYISKIGQSQGVYLDGDALVGGLSDRISKDLAARQRRSR